MRLLQKVLRKNTSASRVAGFVISNFIGLAIVLGALAFYNDARALWEDEDSFVKTDYLVVNKIVSGAGGLGGSTGFNDAELEELRSQPWVRSVGEFRSTDYSVLAAVGTGRRNLSTYMFFESIPDKFVDVAGSGWRYRPGDSEVPIIISKDYLTLYNFGFAGSAGLPEMSEGVMGSIPLSLQLTSEDGTKRGHFTGRIVGFSNRLNTILVPDSFMDFTNLEYGSGGPAKRPSRLIIDVNSPGDVAIGEYLTSHGLEVAGDKRGSSASYLLKVVIGIVVAVGALITLLSFFILMLSVSLILEKNRDKLHTLLMLGYDVSRVASPYRNLVIWASLVAYLLAVAAMFLLRGMYVRALQGLGMEPGSVWLPIVTGGVATLLIILFNLAVVQRKVRRSWRL